MKISYGLEKTFLVFLVALAFFGIVTGCSCSKDKAKSKTTNNNKEVLDENSSVVVKDVKVNGLDFVDFVVVYDEGISDVYFTVQNNTDEAITYNEVECSIYNKNKELLFTFTKELGTLESLDEKSIDFHVNTDLTKAAEVEYVLR